MTPASQGPPDREQKVLALLRLALARAEAGQPVDVAELCRDEPELAAEVAAALAPRAALADLLAVSRCVDPLVGSTLAGRYRLRERLGQGAMGVVYRADDAELKREVAVKLFSPLLGGDPSAEQRFVREAELLARLCHPHVVTVYDRGRSEQGMLFLVTELLVGAPLAELADHAAGADQSAAEWPEVLRRSPPPETSPLRLAVRWARELAAGLSAAHAAGVFHRDVKPSNAFVRDDHRAVLLDFGIAAGDDASFTATNATLGTPYYMAPEQAAGTVRRAASVDVYGLCATLYHLLAGRPPYVGDARVVLARILREDPEPLARLRPDLPRDLRAIVERGMERDPKRRYADMKALEGDLRAFLAHRPVAARPVGALGRMARRMRRAPAAAAAAALGVLAVVLLIVVVPLLGHWRGARLAEELRELDRHLPPLLAFEGTPEQRTKIPAAEQASHLARLDAMLALDPALLLPRLLRAGVREDLGDARGAAADLEVLARASGDPFLSESALHTAQPAPSPASSPASVARSEPTTLAGRCACATHLLRRRVGKFARDALAALEPARAEPAARELRIVALLSHGERGGGEAAYVEILEELTALRSRHGYDTARWLAAEGTALLVLRRHEDAVATLQEADRLAPGRHGTLVNLGVAYRRTSRLEEARAVLVKAKAIRPWIAITDIELALVLRDLGDFDQALAVATALPETGDDAWRRFDLLGGVHLSRAIRDWAEGRREESKAGAARARSAFGAAARLPGAPRARLAALGEVARSLRDDDRHDTAYLLEQLAKDPANPYEIDTVATLLDPQPLSEDGIVALRRFFRSLASALAPGDTAFRDRQKRLSETEQREAEERKASKR